MQNNMYQHAKDYILRIGGAAIILLAPNIGIAKNPEAKEIAAHQPAPKQGILEGTGKFIGDYLDNSFNKYESLDRYVYGDIGDKDRLDQILYGVAHFPGHYVADSLRAAGAVFIEIPQEAMRRARAEKESKKQAEATPAQPTEKKHNPILGIIKTPLDVLWDAGEYGTEVLTDSVRFLGHYGSIAVKGTLDKITKEPLDFTAETAASYAIGKWIHDETKGRDKPSVTTEERPPAPPEGLPGQPWWKP